MVFKIHGVQCSYGSHRALKGVSFDIEPGTFLGIVGPNAAGKSTLMKTIAATLKPVQGVVYFQGEDLTEISRKDLAKQVAVVPQEIEMHFPFTVMEVVLMGRHPHLGRFDSEDEDDYKIAEQAMKDANCLHLKERSVLELSGGERQKVVLARALAQDPQIILLDEPVAHLDLNAQLEVLNLLKKMNTEHNVTVVGILHDLNLAAQFCQQLMILRGGEVYAAGLPEAVLTVENIKDVYNTDVMVIKHPLTGAPQIVILPSPSERETSCSLPRVHLICGGGVGAALMGQLQRMGCHVTAGVVNIQDTDWEVARALGIEVIEEKPFSPISQQVYEDNLKLAGEADVIFLLETPFGRGNLANIQVLEPLLAMGKPCYLVDGERLAERDYTDGEVKFYAAQLQKQGLRMLPDQLSVLKIIQTLREGKDDGETALG